MTSSLPCRRCIALIIITPIAICLLLHYSASLRKKKNGNTKKYERDSWPSAATTEKKQKQKVCRGALLTFRWHTYVGTRYVISLAAFHSTCLTLCRSRLDAFKYERMKAFQLRENFDSTIYNFFIFQCSGTIEKNKQTWVVKASAKFICCKFEKFKIQKFGANKNCGLTHSIPLPSLPLAICINVGFWTTEMPT